MTLRNSIDEISSEICQSWKEAVHEWLKAQSKILYSDGTIGPNAM
jgi:hypothetical protein